MPASETSTVARRALITGIDGFTGPFIEAELQSRGFEVHGTIFDAAGYDGEHRHRLDLLDRDAVARLLAEVMPTHVIHLAAVSFVATADVDMLYRANIVGTRNLLHALAQTCVPQSVILASSANIYGNARISPIGESCEAAPASDYAVSKLAVEYLARLWADRLPITVVRPFNYTGIGQQVRFLVPKIVDAYRRRLPRIELGNLDIARDFSDVRDIASAYAMIAALELRGVFNLCSGTGWSIADIVGQAEAITGHRLEIAVNPLFVRTDEIKHLVGANAVFRANAPSWSPRPFEETLAWMLGNSSA